MWQENKGFSKISTKIDFFRLKKINKSQENDNFRHFWQKHDFLEIFL